MAQKLLPLGRGADPFPGAFKNGKAQGFLRIPKHPAQVRLPHIQVGGGLGNRPGPLDLHQVLQLLRVQNHNAASFLFGFIICKMRLNVKGGGKSVCDMSKMIYKNRLASEKGTGRSGDIYSALAASMSARYFLTLTSFTTQVNTCMASCRSSLAGKEGAMRMLLSWGSLP